MINNTLISISKLKGNDYAITTLIRSRKNTSYKHVNCIYCKDLNYGSVSNSLFCSNGDYLICNMDLDGCNTQDLTDDDIFRGIL